MFWLLVKRSEAASKRFPFTYCQTAFAEDLPGLALLVQPCLSSHLPAQQFLHDVAVRWRVGEYCPYKDVRVPQRMLDHSAAAQVLDVKAQVTVPVVRLEQSVVGVRSKELRRSQSHH